MSTKKCLHSDKIFPRNSDMGLLRFRRTIKMRVDRCQGILKKIDHDSKLMRLCFRQLMDLMDDCRKIVKVEQELNIHLLQLLDGYSSGKIDLSAKTQTVTPMVAGYPLKKASIMLKRLDPLRELQSNNNSREKSKRSQIKSSRADQASILHDDVQPRNRETLLASARNEEDNSPMGIILPTCEVRCRRWPTPVSPASFGEFRIKQASIPLIRLDLQSLMIAEGGTAKLSTSRNGPFCDIKIEGTAFEPEPCGSSVETESNCESQSALISEEQNRFPVHRQSDPCIQLSPFVVLERLNFAPGCGSTRSSFLLPSSISYNNYNGVELRQISCNMSSENNDHDKCKHSLKCKIVSGEDHQETEVDSEDEGSSTESEICDKSVTASRITGNGSKESKGSPKQPITSKSMKRKTSDYYNRKTKFCHSFPHEKKDTLEMENEDDPLEGPSWLYKDGMLKKARLMELEKIRKDYFISFHYLPPTVYSSSDGSGDEIINEESSHKRRKRRSARRS